MRFLETEDDLEALILAEMANEVMKVKVEMMEQNANLIANEVARRFGGS